MNASLDINTPRGKIAASDQERATQIVFGNNPKFQFIQTPLDDSAAVDGFIVSAGIVTGVAEVKSRDMDYATLMHEFKCEWLITYQKLLDLQSVSRLLKLPGYGLLYVKHSALVLVVTVCDASGDFCCRMRLQRTETQATCNGGLANRENAFIDMRGAKIYRENS